MSRSCSALADNLSNALIAFGLLGCGLALFPMLMCAQELQPRAYLPAPVGINFFSVSYSRNSGGLLFDPSLPVEDARVDANVTTFAFAQSLGVVGRSAQVLAVLPYAVANLSGTLAGQSAYRYRSGLTDSTFRFAINIKGGPAMHLKEFATYRQRTIIGTSVTVNAPTGQYDPNVLINIGTHRWAIKPELGISHNYRRWSFEGAFGAWLYTKNPNFGGNSVRTQDPLGSIQAHVVRLLSRRTWVAFDATFYTGGRTYVNGRDAADYQGNTRLGATFGISLNRRQALKIAYFDGVTTRFGSDIQSILISYQVIWLKGR